MSGTQTAGAGTPQPPVTPAPAPCSCPDARRMGASDGVIHPHLRGCDGCHRELRSYLWVVDGQHLCGRCRFGPGDEG